MSDTNHPLHIVLYEPEIPPNTGNLIRFCANTGIKLHLIEPLGFSLDTKALRRAGLDYHESANVEVHANLNACIEMLNGSIGDHPLRIFGVTTKGSVRYDTPRYQAADVLLFGPETRGLPDQVLEDSRLHGRIRIPMRAGSRSLNLSNAAAVIAYEALRQLDYPELA